jgi:hypothetical protein
MALRVQRADDPPPWQFVARRALLAAAMLLLTSSCQPDPGEAAAVHIRAATELEAEGRLDEAVAELAAAIALKPDDAELRRLRARLLLGAGNGKLAAVEINTAIRLGMPRDDLLPDLAEALVLEGQPLEALDLVRHPDQLPEGTPPGLRVRHASVRALALLATRNADAADVQAALLQVFRLVGDAGNTGKAEAARFARLRGPMPAVERAWQHHACRSAVPVRYPAAADPAKAGGRVLQVGPGRPFATPAAAARAARSGDTVEIDAGAYPSGSALWPQDRLTIRGIGASPADRARVTASHRGIEDRDVWLLTGDDVRIENVEISGARAGSSRNGAAVRHMGRNLVLRNVYLHDNENGLLTGDRAPESEILIEHSEFARNGYGDGLSHNIYVGHAGSLTVRFSWSHGARSGHLIKSRARRNLILANRLTDGEQGRASYLIDLSIGGIAVIAGNVLQKSFAGENPAFIIFAAEGAEYDENTLLVVNNTFWNGRYKATGIRNRSTAAANVANNIFAGAPVLALDGPGTLTTNLRRAETGLMDPRALDFSLMADSAAIDAGTDLASLDPRLPLPLVEYVHPLGGRERLRVSAPDLGAFEFCGE